MFPDLFTIGPLTIHTYGAFVAMGFVAALVVTVRLAGSYGLAASQVMDMGFVSIVWGIIGSRLLFVLLNLSYYRSHPLDTLKVWQGGLVFSGGLVAAALALLWHSRRHRLSFWSVGDLWAPGVALGQGLGRIGCLMAGCCYGKPTDVPWAIVFCAPHSLAPLNMPLHPTQIYAALSGFVIFTVLLLLHRSKKYEGQVFLWFLILHSTARLLVERFRADDRGMVPGTDMSLTQLVATLVLLAAVATLFVLKSKTEKKPR
ncbi:MAG: prolipoprotein diacylglyceryl transferase [Deltaproteobacteria bacterium]|nr:prolipoprotein diacylglyceryl transferase [Deltaproteobacteria bacterium]